MTSNFFETPNVYYKNTYASHLASRQDEPQEDAFHLFIRGTTNPIVVDLSLPCYYKFVYLQGFTIKGTPVTDDVPDNIFTNFEFQGTTGAMNVITRSDGGPGFPLPLTGTFSHLHYDPYIHVGVNSAALKRFNLRLSNPDGTNTTFTDAAFWMYFSDKRPKD